MRIHMNGCLWCGTIEIVSQSKCRSSNVLQGWGNHCDIKPSILIPFSLSHTIMMLWCSKCQQSSMHLTHIASGSLTGWEWIRIVSTYSLEMSWDEPDGFGLVKRLCFCCKIRAVPEIMHFSLQDLWPLILSIWIVSSPWALLVHFFECSFSISLHFKLGILMSGCLKHGYLWEVFVRMDNDSGSWQSFLDDAINCTLLLCTQHWWICQETLD